MQSFDAIVVGAGFADINQLYQLRQLGLSVKLFEKAPYVGGVWYWNQWLNATSDAPSEVYRYSWDKEDLLTYPWPTHVLP
jgi:cation diffusion facilitator CzcD-associated flavoprotein CzcO